MREHTLANYRRQTGLGVLSIAIIGAVALLVVAVAAGGAYFFMRPAQANAKPQTAEKQPPPEPVFVEIKPFTVNLQGSQGRVLYVGLSLSVPDDKAAERIKTHLPQVRNRILMTLSDRDAQTLATQHGKMKLATLLGDQLRQPLTEKAEPLAIDDVLFTNFILQ